MYTSTMMTTELEHRVLSYEELETLLATLLKDLGKRFQVDKSASVGVKMPGLEEDAIIQHDAFGDNIDEDTVEGDAAEATTVEDFHKLVLTKKWRMETRNVRKGDIVLIMYTGSPSQPSTS